MAQTKINSSGVTFPDSTVQATAAVVGQLNYALYTSGSGTWTCPAGVTKVLAIVIAGGGGYGGTSSGAGFCGGVAIGIYTVTPSTGYSYTVGAGAGGTGGYAGSGGSSSFSSFCSATGGGNGNGAPGAGSGGTFSNWRVADADAPTLTSGVGGVFVGYIAGQSTASGNWSASHGNLPGAYNASTATYAGGGVVYLQYIG